MGRAESRTVLAMVVVVVVLGTEMALELGERMATMPVAGVVVVD